ncbi:MarR family transcriptional regulator [Natrinema sp. LN54]|uniref:MarR family transcriptional regulator n=1 Tax=Natrinema sp. LN54 TaxID=3458705 RepID=UPI004036B213
MSRQRLERTVLDALADESPRYVVDLAAVIDEHPITVEQACDRLRDGENVRSVGCRRYEITAAGRRRVDDAQPATGESAVSTETESRS